MPIIKSAKKRMIQATVRRGRNFAVRRSLKMAVRKFMDFIKAGEKTQATEVFANTQKVIDTAAKKNIIHANKAARMKSSLSKMIAE